MVPIKESRFMSDHSEGDHGLESILDYELSWVLRMAADAECKEKQPLLYHQCRHILFKLLKIRDFANIQVTKVNVWKQWHYVDLIADVYLCINGECQLHVLMTENKAYTSMKEKQRDEYPNVVKNTYANPPYTKYPNYLLHQALITCYEEGQSEYKQLRQFIKGTSWDLFSVSDLPDGDAESATESDLFNEFWLYSWNRLE